MGLLPALPLALLAVGGGQRHSRMADISSTCSVPGTVLCAGGNPHPEELVVGVGQWQQNVTRPTMGKAQGAVGLEDREFLYPGGSGKGYLSWVWEKGRKSAQRPLSAAGTHTPLKTLEPQVFLKGTGQVRQAHLASTKRVAQPCPQSCS